MWKFTLKDGTVINGDRKQIAEQLNFFEDVYDEDIWNKFCSYYQVQYVKN